MMSSKILLIAKQIARASRYFRRLRVLGGVSRTISHEIRTDMFRRYANEVVYTLSSTFGERNLHSQWGYDALDASFLWLKSRLNDIGFESLEIQSFVCRHREVSNLVAEVRGSSRPEEIVVIGAHYDSSPECPGANDNATGVAAVLALADYFSSNPQERTLRFAFFVNEEPPFFRSDDMGSSQYVGLCKERGDHVVAMITPDTIGYYSDEPGSQYVPDFIEDFGWSVPTTGNFLAIVGVESMGELISDVAESASLSGMPVLPLAIPENVPGVGWSDHSSFIEAGFPAIMVTDTALYRYQGYHQSSDTADKIVYDRLVVAIDALRCALERVGNGRSLYL